MTKISSTLVVFILIAILTTIISCNDNNSPREASIGATFEPEDTTRYSFQIKNLTFLQTFDLLEREIGVEIVYPETLRARNEYYRVTLETKPRTFTQLMDAIVLGTPLRYAGNKTKVAIY